MKLAQLPLIEELSLACNTDVTPSRPARKFVVPSSLPHSFMLMALLSGPMPLEKLLQMAGSDDGAALIFELRQFGVELLCHEVPVFDIEGNIGFCTVCTLTLADTRRVKRWLQRGGGTND